MTDLRKEAIDLLKQKATGRGKSISLSIKLCNHCRGKTDIFGAYINQLLHPCACLIHQCHNGRVT